MLIRSMACTLQGLAHKPFRSKLYTNTNTIQISGEKEHSMHASRIVGPNNLDKNQIPVAHCNNEMFHFKVYGVKIVVSPSDYAKLWVRT